LWFVADSNDKRREWDSRIGRDAERRVEHAGDVDGVADTKRFGQEMAIFHNGSSGATGSERETSQSGMRQFIGELADTDGEQCEQGLQSFSRRPAERLGGGYVVSDVANTSDDRPQRRLSRWADAERQTFDGPIGRDSSDCRTRQVNNFWGATDWLHCRDEKWRPVEPGTFPLAHGPTARVGRLRAYGNAIVPQVAQALIEAYLSCN
jgi:DNA (cytosine-5)-methyltransferase 1